MKDRFFEIIKSSNLVLVEFYADWCVPCKFVPPILKEVKKRMRLLRVIKVNVDDNLFIANRFNVNQIPTIILFQKGKLLWRNKGFVDAEEIIGVLKKYTKSGNL